MRYEVGVMVYDIWFMVCETTNDSNILKRKERSLTKIELEGKYCPVVSAPAYLNVIEGPTGSFINPTTLIGFGGQLRGFFSLAPSEI